MTNPYEAFNISDDEQDQFVATNKTEKVRKTHKERRQMKKLGTQEAPKTTTGGINTQVPVKVKENLKQIRHNRNENGRPFKGVPEGHPLDRRSGTGRQDRPRKGRGIVGNVETELNKDKFEKPEQATSPVPELPEGEAPQEQQKPQEPEKLTLAEYYQSKGIDINATSAQRKVPVKGQVNAEWLKKEKLTLIETKEDKRRQESVRQNVLQHNNTRVEMDLGNSEILGFGKKPAQRPREQEPQRANNNDRGQKGKKPQPKAVIKEEDFPSL